MLRLTKETVKTQLRAVDGVPVYGDGLEISLVQSHCCQRLLIELDAEAAEDGFQLCTQSVWREALLRRQRRKGFVAMRLVQGLEDRRRLEACRSEWKHDGSSAQTALVPVRAAAGKDDLRLPAQREATMTSTPLEEPDARLTGREVIQKKADNVDKRQEQLAHDSLHE
ncbi:unnamed protein product [Alternaria alternata]